MKMWKTNPLYYRVLVEEVEVERISDSSVWINGMRHPRNASRECYFSSSEQAFAYLTGVAEGDVSLATARRDRAQEVLDKVFKARQEGVGHV